ncbi:MAG: sulfotransferase family 2 domain-containing protein [Stappiaceae bacterium]
MMISELKKAGYKIKKSLSKRVLYFDKNYNYKNFYGTDCLAIFPELNVCFNRIKKSGNTSTCAYLSEICGYPVSETTPEMKDRIKTPYDLGIAELFKLRNFHSLVVVRDPYARALSTYLDKVAPGTNFLFAKCPGFGDRTAEGFLRFLKFLEVSGTKFDKHFWPQVDFLYQPADRFSCVAKLESLTTDLGVFFESIGVQSELRLSFDRPHPLEAAEPGKVTSAQKKLTQYYDVDCHRIVEEVYRADFDAFDYRINR